MTLKNAFQGLKTRCQNMEIAILQNNLIFLSCANLIYFVAFFYFKMVVKGLS